jgi:hypothetical protein
MLLPVHVVHINHKVLAPIIFAAVGLSFFSAEATPAPRPSVAVLSAITERGRLLAEYDAAAWQATDTVSAAQPKADSSGRYIARKTVTGWVVDFGRCNGTGDKFLVAYEATQTGSPAHFEVKSFQPMREDTGWNLAAAKGIETAMRDFHGASRVYNVAVLPAEREGMYVYLYPAQVKNRVYLLGDDVRYHISPDGMKIVEKRQMHNSVIELTPSRTEVEVATGYHTHVLSDVPEDTDVLLVLTRQPCVPEIVVTRSYMYTIAVDGKITVEDRPKQ